MMGVAFRCLAKRVPDEVQPLTECQNGFLGGRGFPVKVTVTGQTWCWLEQSAAYAILAEFLCDFHDDGRQANWTWRKTRGQRGGCCFSGKMDE
jgi:hypothetical protein